MRKLIYLFIVATVLFSCQNSNTYTINGTVVAEGYEGTNVYLQEMTQDAMVATDSAVVTNGAFSFKGTADSTVLRFVALDETVNPQQENRIPVLVEPGKLVLTFDSIVDVKGTKVNEDYTSFRLVQKDLVQNIREVIGQFNSEGSAGTLTEEREAELKESYDIINDQMIKANYDFVKANIKNELGEFVFLNSFSMFEPEQQREILNDANEDYKATENIQRVVSRLDNLENVAIGKKFVDFTLKDTEGNDVSLSDFAGQGKYVLIDFWAAWCGPCRQEMPHVVAAYKKYKAKGFEVVGVSFDQDAESWKKGIKDLNMTWPQMSDLMYWSSPVVDLYAINGIPHTVLLDKDGVIIEKNLRGDALDAKLAELMP